MEIIKDFAYQQFKNQVTQLYPLGGLTDFAIDQLYQLNVANKKRDKIVESIQEGYGAGKEIYLDEVTSHQYQKFADENGIPNEKLRQQLAEVDREILKRKEPYKEAFELLAQQTGVEHSKDPAVQNQLKAIENGSVPEKYMINDQGEQLKFVNFGNGKFIHTHTKNLKDPNGRFLPTNDPHEVASIPDEKKPWLQRLMPSKRTLILGGTAALGLASIVGGPVAPLIAGAYQTMAGAISLNTSAITLVGSSLKWFGGDHTNIVTRGISTLAQTLSDNKPAIVGVLDTVEKLNVPIAGKFITGLGGAHIATEKVLSAYNAANLAKNAAQVAIGNEEQRAHGWNNIKKVLSGASAFGVELVEEDIKRQIRSLNNDPTLEQYVTFMFNQMALPKADRNPKASDILFHKLKKYLNNTNKDSQIVKSFVQAILNYLHENDISNGQIWFGKARNFASNDWNIPFEASSFRVDPDKKLKATKDLKFRRQLGNLPAAEVGLWDYIQGKEIS